MANANLTMGVNGIDKTAAAFNSVKARARATGAQIRSIMGGAIAAAGAYLSLRSIKGGIEELGKLSDMGMKANTSVEFLTKSATAFKIAGLDVSVESLTRSLQMMQKNTGEKGEAGFYKTIRAIQQLPDDMQRAQAMVKVFGRSGLELLPLVTNGAAAIDNFQKLQQRMIGVSSAAANAGDEASDALTRFGDGAVNLMRRALGKIVDLWLKLFPGGIQASVETALAYIEYFGKIAYAKISKWGTNFMASFAWWGDLFTGGYDQANNMFARTTNMAEADAKAYIDAAAAKLEATRDRLKEESKEERENQRNPFGNRATDLGEEIGAAAAKAATRISNQLITGNSNAAQRLSILGPNYQNEQKKQTSLLEKIEKNTAKSADNSESETYPATDLK